MYIYALLYVAHDHVCVCVCVCEDIDVSTRQEDAQAS